MELWIPITIGAAFAQNLRSALQKHLKERLGTSGATFVRFLYAAPLATLYVAALYVSGQPLPEPGSAFFGFTVLGGVSQILATALLVSLFSYRNFAVGTTYSKTETLQTAVFGVVILGETVAPLAAAGILVSLGGVVAISLGTGAVGVRGLVRGLGQRSALIGMASGACFGLAAVSYRAAALALGGEGFLMQAGFTLACVTVFQTLVMGGYLLLREPGELSRTLRAWRVAGLVGVCGMVASACWFSAMTLTNAAYVKALGQVELVFTFAASYFFFRERTRRRELAGIVLVVTGILMLALAA